MSPQNDQISTSNEVSTESLSIQDVIDSIIKLDNKLIEK